MNKYLEFGVVGFIFISFKLDVAPALNKQINK